MTTVEETAAENELVVSAYLTCLTCNIRSSKTFEESIKLEEFEKYKVNLLCQKCNSPYTSVIPVFDFEVQYGNKVKEEAAKKKNEFYIQKYGRAEAVIVNELPFFLELEENSTEPILRECIEAPGMSLKPLDKIAYLNKEYSFKSLKEIKEYVKRAETETLDTLYQKVKTEWSKFIDADNDHLTICAGDTIFTYFQDKFGMTHYLMFIGDNNTGKSNNLKVMQYLGYRPLFDTSITPANIYQFLGGVEEGQGIILEDEVDNIDRDDEKLKIYKVGYQSGTKVTRTDISFGRKQEGRWTYCFKAYSAEKLPSNMKAKGLNERIFVIPCSTGKPQYDITEVINPAGDSKHSKLLAELLDIRKLLLVYRLLHYNSRIPDIELNIRNRDKQLCKPLIRLFQKSECREEIMSTLSRLIADKRDRKIETLDARLYQIIVNLVKEEKGTKLTNKKIWEAIKSNIEGFVTSDNTYETEEFYEISKTKVTGILKGKFGAKACHAGPEGKDRGLEFNKEILDKSGSNYAKLEPIRIISDTSDTSDTSRVQVPINTDTISDNNQENMDIDEHEMNQVDSREEPKNTDTYGNKPSEPSEVSEAVRVRCPNDGCGVTGDPNSMRVHIHNCERNV